MSKLKFWEKEEYELSKGDYTKFSRMVRKDPSAVYGIMISMCHISATNRLETEEDCQEMLIRKRLNAMKLHGLMRKIFNGSSSVITEDVAWNIIEYLHNFCLD